ncbi:hypothetical protein ACE30Q_000357, partial [Salmonella enterica]
KRRSPSVRTGFFASVAGYTLPDGGSALSSHRNYPAYEAGAIVEPIRAKPTQPLTMNYPLHLLI